MRFSTELLLLAFAGGLASWSARAPAEARARAAYFCAPVVSVARAANRLQAAFSDGGQVIPPATAWQFEPQRDCPRAMLRIMRENES